MCVCVHGVSAGPVVVAQKLHQTQTSADFKHLPGFPKVKYLTKCSKYYVRRINKDFVYGKMFIS